MDVSRRHQVRDVTRIIGERIRLGRSQAGLTQEKLAAALGVSFQQVQKYEKGTNRVAACTLIAIADELGRDVSFFLPGGCAVIGPGEAASLDAQIADARQALSDAIQILSDHHGRLGAAAARVTSAAPAREREIAAARFA